MVHFLIVKVVTMGSAAASPTGIRWGQDPGKIDDRVKLVAA